MNDALVSEAEAARCSRPPCMLRSHYDLVRMQTVIQHANDENLEHLLRIPDCVRRRPRHPQAVLRYLRRWLHRVHTWEQRDRQPV